jgi:hypothetical protein
LRPRIDLFLVRDSLRDYLETTYFSGKLHTFTARLIEAIEYVLDNQSSLNPDVVKDFSYHALMANRYLAGSTTKESPYELEYCLRAVIRKWSKRDCLITTALTDGRDFHFYPVDPWEFVKTALPNFDTKGFDAPLVQLGVPRIYSHKPLFCIPLYHELGHFVDISNSVVELSLLRQPATTPYEHAHRREHFADLFAAAYVGESSIRTLETIAPNHPATASHPATKDRVAMARDFLGGRLTPLIALFQGCLVQLGLPALKIEYSSPSIRDAFDDIRTFQISSEAELHGLFESAWKYFEDALDKRAAPWASTGMTDAEIERIVNDLTEKSIRNASIRERWSSGAAP